MNNTIIDFKTWASHWLSRLSHDMEMRSLPSRRQLWSRDAAEIAAFVEGAQEAKEHVYFGVLGRATRAGGKDAIKEAHCLWADIDFKDLPEGQIEADGIVATFDHRPSVQIHSGGGYHLYWLLHEPTTDLDRVERILKGLAKRLKADIKSAETARILRPPYTTNWKYHPPRQVEVVSFDLDGTYALDDFKDWELPDQKIEPVLTGEVNEKIDLTKYLKHYRVPVVKVIKAGDATLYCLKKCLFEEGHTTGQGNVNEAAIGQQPDGKLFYQCFHQHCADKAWTDVRAKISANDSLTQFLIRELRPLIEKYVSELTGETSIGSMLPWLDIKTMPERQEAMTILSELAEKRHIVWTGRKHGAFRPVDKSPNIMRLWGEKSEPLKIELPFNLHRIVNIYRRNVINVGGEKDAGKTAFGLNTAYANRDRVPVRYLNSEMGTEELEARLSLFNYPQNEWKKITWIEKASRFEDAIDPEGFNIIDYLEVGADAYAVVEDIKRVFDRLTTGLLLIIMQKRSYKEWAVGGEGTLEKARLAVNLQHRDGKNICKITVAKNWTGEIRHPKGYECEYKVLNGARMEMTPKGWYDPDAEEAWAEHKSKKLNILSKKG